MSEDLKIVIKNLVKAQQEQTAALIDAQREQISAIVDQITSMISKISTVPAFEHFDSKKENYVEYMARMEQHFQSCGVSKPDDQKSRFLSWVGSETYHLLGKIRPEFEKDCTYEELKQILVNYEDEGFHFIHARVEFGRCNLKPDQTYKQWVAELRSIAKRCKFVCPKDSCNRSLIDESIRDAIILRTPHKNIQTALLQQKNLSLDNVLSICESMVLTSRTMKAIEAPDIDVSVNKVEKIKSFSGQRVKWKSCKQCYVSHDRRECPNFSKTCRICKKLGHLEEVCRAKFIPKHRESKTKYSRPAKWVNQVRRSSVGLVHLHVSIEGKPFMFLVDTGAECSIINRDVLSSLNKTVHRSTSYEVRSFGGSIVPIMGSIQLNFRYQGAEISMGVLVADSSCCSNILGLDLIKSLKLDLNAVFTCNSLSVSKGSPQPSEIISKFPSLFEPNRMGTCKDFQATLYLKEGARPVFHKSRNIPLALHGRVKGEIDRLVSNGVLVEVNTSEWAFPIVVVPRPDGKIRLCADFRVGLNSQLLTEQYPLPTLDDLLSKLKHTNVFSKIDLSEAYHQIPMTQASQKLLVINTPFGLFQFTRLPFGVSSAPAIFQRYLESILSGIEDCATFLDDIIISGSSTTFHLETVNKVLNVLENNGLSCKAEKCRFFVKEVDYLGHIISEKGIRPSISKVEAIDKLPVPRNIQELECFLGKMNFYSKFIHNYSTISFPLNILRRKGVTFKWGQPQVRAFQELKNSLINTTILTKFDPSLPIILSTDASSVGIGAVLLHRLQNGLEVPLAHASKTLTPTQSRYSQLEKEGLAVIYGLKKFHYYLYGREFEIITDNKNLVSLFSPIKRFPVLAAQRIQRWNMLLMAYTYKITFRGTKDHANADALSRFPSGPDPNFDAQHSYEINSLNLIDIPYDFQRLRDETSKDSNLKLVLRYMSTAWPGVNKNSPLYWFFKNREFISSENGVLTMNRGFPRIIIPKSLQQVTLKMIHKGHWGMTRAKQLARRYCTWEEIEKDIDAMIKNCVPCSVNSRAPNQSFTAWPKATSAFERIHVDFLGPFMGFVWLIAIDSYSHYPFVIQMNGFSASHTVSALKSIFSIEGLPETIVSDNGTQFSSETFSQFCKELNIKHVFSPPYHPQSNGQAERFVQTFKHSVQKSRDSGSSLQDAVFDFLITYRSTPVYDEKSPSELLHGRQIRNLLAASLGKPKKYTSSENLDQFCETVWVKNFHSRPKWVKGKIIRRVGKNIFEVDVNGKMLRRHRNQIKSCYVNPDSEIQYFENISTSPRESDPVPIQAIPVRRSERLKGKTFNFKEGAGKCYNRHA